MRRGLLSTLINTRHKETERNTFLPVVKKVHRMIDCHYCGESIRSDYYLSHMREKHQTIILGYHEGQIEEDGNYTAYTPVVQKGEQN